MRDLGLTGNDLLVFSTIHCYSQQRVGCYFGSAVYLANLWNISLRTVREILKRLTEKGYINKFDIYRDGVKYCAYQTCAKFAFDDADFALGSAETASEAVKNLPFKGAESAHNNNSDNVEDKSSTNIGIIEGRAPAREGKVSRFIPPTIQEVNDYVNTNGYVLCDPATFISHYESNGWIVGKNKMKDWQASVRSWHYRRLADSRPTPLQIKRASL